MNCLVCESSTSEYFSKRFDLPDLEVANYVRCGNCGLVISISHLEMSSSQWTNLNVAWHDSNNSRVDDPHNRRQRYFHQSQMLHLLIRHEILAKPKNWIDWGGGEGLLASRLEKNYDIKCSTYERYVTAKHNPIEESDLVTRGHDLVLNTAVLEHVRDRATMNEIESYVADDGCFAPHTLVRGEIPADPDWFYLLPVHCVFFTNRSMSLLMRQWNYECSIYNELAKLWIWFRKDSEQLRTGIDEVNDYFGFDYLHFKSGFMDFWP